MLTGVIYAFVGIQHRLIYVFLSAAYLVSLSVTILILYVMNPPVSDAIQGAYLVAITATGLVLGGGAMVFPDLTEGFGCLLGGFCLSMWLLVLQPGGLLTGTIPIVIFIVVFSVVIWATAYIPYTKPYGLIGSLAFAGATVIVLGIDCFSRAGLKEFWMYIWRLNDKVFPLGTTTYPMTRGIKVEIAAIIIIAFVGIMTQMKLWKFIKKRRDRRAADRAEERRGLDREEAMVGRRVEWETTRARQHWEAVHGAAASERRTSFSADSGIGDMSVKEKEKLPKITVHDEIEMADLPSPTGSGRSGEAGSSKEGLDVGDSGRQSRRKSRDEEALATLSGDEPGTSSKRNSRSKRISRSPDTPFPSLDVNKGDARRSQRGSRLLHRLSHNSTTGKRLSRPLSEQGLTGQDEWERASSIAATLDDLESEVDYEDLRSLPSGTPRASMVLDKALAVAEGNSSPTATEAPDGGKESGKSELRPSPSTLSLTKDVLPPAPPKLATSFRTQEWAKHLSLAEALPIPDLTPSPTSATSPTFPPSPISSLPPPSPTPQSHRTDAAPTEADEASAPLNVAALVQTAAAGSVGPAPARPRSAMAGLRPKSAGGAARASVQGLGGMPALPARLNSVHSGGNRASRVDSDDVATAQAQRKSVVRQSEMYLAPSPSKSRPTSSQQRPVSSVRLEVRGAGNQNSLGTLNKGVVRPEVGDLELMERRRSELWEEKRRGEIARREDERRRRGVEGGWAERMRRGEGGEVHREGLRRLMGEGK